MSLLLLQNQLSIDTLVVPGYFIDRFLPAASGTDIKVYLYLLRAVSTSAPGLSSASISDSLDISEKEVLRALSYWEKAGLLRLSFTSDHELNGVAFTDPPAKKQDVSLPVVNTKVTEAAPQTKAASFSSDSKAAVSARPAPAEQAAPSYSKPEPEDDSCHLSQEDQALLDHDPELNIYMAAWQQYFPQPFTYSDTERISYWYLKFNRSIEVIDYLVDYCASHDHPNTNYMNKVALAWHKKGFRTLTEIRNHNQLCSNTAYAVMKAYGLYNQKPAPSQLDFIERWVNEYGFSTEMLVHACNRTMEKLQRPDMKYTEGILRNWKKKNIRTTADVEAEDTLHTSRSKTAASRQAVPSAAKTAKSFSNFKERSNNNYTEKIFKQYSQDTSDS